jgi:hypothetical protein
MSNTANTTPASTQERGRGTPTHTRNLSHCVRRLDKSTIPQFRRLRHKIPRTYTVTSAVTGISKKEGSGMKVDETTQAVVHTQDNISYTQVDKKDGNSTHCHTPEAAAPVDQLYAQVDKRKKNARSRTPEAATPVAQLDAQVDMDKKDGNSTHCHTPGAAAPVVQLYALVDKRKKNTRSRTPEVATPVAQLYAQVDKKRKGKGE